MMESVTLIYAYKEKIENVYQKKDQGSSEQESNHSKPI